MAGVVAAAASTGMVTLAPAKTVDGVLQADPNSPLFSSRNVASDFKGFDVAIANLLAAERNSEKVTLIPAETVQRVPFLVADTIDIALGGLTRNSVHAKRIEYTFPPHTEVRGVLTTDKHPITSYNDLNGQDGDRRLKCRRDPHDRPGTCRCAGGNA